MSRFFMYGPNGEAKIFTDPDEVPEGWRDHPFAKSQTAGESWGAKLNDGIVRAIDVVQVIDKAVGGAPKADLTQLDHDGDGEPGGSISGGSGEEIKALRAEYTRTIGKKPFAGWKEDQLRERIAAAQG